MGVGPAEAEGTDAGPPRASARRPRPRLVGDGDGQVRPLDEWIRAVEIQMPWNGFVLQRQHHLDEARDAGRRLEMADIGLDRADQQRRVWIAPLAQNPAERPDFDRIAERSASPVRFDIINVRAIETGSGERARESRIPEPDRSAR